MNRHPWMISVGVVLLAVILIGGMAEVVQAQMCAMSGQTGQTSAAPGQPSMMGEGKMGQGMCPMCMMQTTAARTEGTPQSMGMMDMPGMKEDSQIDAKTRAHMLQMRGEMLKAMGEVMMKYGQTLGQSQ